MHNKEKMITHNLYPEYILSYVNQLKAICLFSTHLIDSFTEHRLEIISFRILNMLLHYLLASSVAHEKVYNF